MTKLTVDVIVNGANTRLLGGVVQFTDPQEPELLEEYREFNDCKTGEAKITKDYRLPTKYVIYTL